VRNLIDRWSRLGRFHQPSLFFPKSVFERVGPLDETLHYCFDLEWLCRALRDTPVHYLERPIGRFRVHSLQKTTAGNLASVTEEVEVARRHGDAFDASERPRIEAFYELDRLGASLAARKTGGMAALRALYGLVARHPRVALRVAFARVFAYALAPKALVASVEERRLRHHTLGGGQPGEKPVSTSRA